MGKDMEHRIREIQDYLGVSTAQFAERIGLNRSNLTHIYSGRNHPSLDVAKRILASVKEISAEWLIMGTGEMLKRGENVGQYDLFAQPLPAESISSKKKNNNKAGVVQEKASPAPDLPESGIGRTGKRVRQIVLFYDDQTFSIHYPE